MKLSKPFRPNARAPRVNSAEKGAYSPGTAPFRQTALTNAVAWLTRLFAADIGASGAAWVRSCSSGQKSESHAPLSACVSRRRMIQVSAAGTIFTAAASSLAVAEDSGEGITKTKWKKSSKEAAGYIERDRPAAQECGSCHFFLDPDECIIVEGPVSPWGYCNFYED